MTPPGIILRFPHESDDAAVARLYAAIRPAAERPRDVALFRLAGLIAFSFDRDQVCRMASGFGWIGFLRDNGFDPDRAFDRHYRDGCMVVALWTPAARGEGRAS